ncbi:hypothetical protein F5Y16DRAFT_413561 [Xylariaceae sp. FL0255]|nr:hypothetical protein F5Y16DRAFT_413561 [Xylariaceae sp. FL0255]
MDWLRSDDTVWDKNMAILDFEPMECKVFTIAKQNSLRLGARAECQGFDPGAVSYLPFSQETFESLIKTFKIHGTIARTISRNTSCAFIRKFESWDTIDQRSIVYSCRSTASWEGDIALSVTFDPESLTTYAVMYGCDNEVTEDIISRLSSSDIPEFHPMVLVTLFAEMERDRLDRLARRKISQMMQRIIDITENANITTKESNHGSSSSSPPTLVVSINEWLELGGLRNGLRSFQKKMEDMKDHVDELHTGLLAEKGDFAARLVTNLKIAENGLRLAEQSQRDSQLMKAIAENGLQVAEQTRRDSELMKSIALLTMIFLPATFVATLFSTGIFNWEGNGGEILVVSPWVWLYVVATIVMTTITLGTWYIWATRRRPSKDVESGSSNSSEKSTLTCPMMSTTTS